VSARGLPVVSSTEAAAGVFFRDAIYENVGLLSASAILVLQIVENDKTEEMRFLEYRRLYAPMDKQTFWLSGALR